MIMSTGMKSSQVDLLPNGEIFDRGAVYSNAEGVTFLGGLGDAPTKKIENLK